MCIISIVIYYFSVVCRRWGRLQKIVKVPSWTIGYEESVLSESVRQRVVVSRQKYESNLRKLFRNSVSFRSLPKFRKVIFRANFPSSSKYRHWGRQPVSQRNGYLSFASVQDSVVSFPVFFFFFFLVTLVTTCLMSE